MNVRRFNHASVSMGSKLFVIGGYKSTSCEVFDSCSRKFININLEIKSTAFDKYFFRAFSIGPNIVIFQHSESYKSVIYLYDVNELRWSTVDCSYTKNYFVQSLIKYYVL